MWTKKLQAVYDGEFACWVSASDTYGLVRRLGYDSVLDAWLANPKVQGSTDPADYKALTKPKPVLAVIYRVWKEAPKTVIAIFPELPDTHDFTMCMSYEQIGQHAGCNPSSVMRKTRQPFGGEAWQLSVELARLGYKLRRIKRLHPKHMWMRKVQLNLA